MPWDCHLGTSHALGVEAKAESATPSTLDIGQQSKGHWGNSENTGGDPHRRRQGRECVCTNGAAGRQTQLEELKNTNTRGARQLESRLDLHARGTKGGHRRAFSGIWLRGLSPAACKVLTGCSACGYAARSSLRSRRPSGPKTPIQYITLHFYY